jgi:hypothetical protein
LSICSEVWLLNFVRLLLLLLFIKIIILFIFSPSKVQTTKLCCNFLQLRRAPVNLCNRAASVSPRRSSGDGANMARVERAGDRGEAVGIAREQGNSEEPCGGFLK